MCYLSIWFSIVKDRSLIPVFALVCAKESQSYIYIYMFPYVDKCFLKICPPQFPVP